jgi:hypothetical protein
VEPWWFFQRGEREREMEERREETDGRDERWKERERDGREEREERKERMFMDDRPRFDGLRI